MTVTINASPTNGLVQTADGSGVIKLQSNGVTTNALAWVNYNGSAQTIRASYNVSSVTRNGTGDYTVNFTNVMSDANYAESMTFVQTGGYYVCPAGTNYAKTTSSFRTGVLAGAGSNPTSFSALDMNFVNIVIFGN